MSNFHREILQVLGRASAPYGHQKLDMWLISGGADPARVSGELLAALRELERDGLVTSTVVGGKTGSPLYAITEAGRYQMNPAAALSTTEPAPAVA